MNNLKKLEVPFCNTTIQAVEHNGELYVSMRPICKNIGLQWGSQYNRIMRDEVMKTAVFIMKTTASDGKKYEYVFLPLSMLNGWLFGVSTKKIKPELKDKLIKYKRECYNVLYQYWTKERFEFMKEINRLLFEFQYEKEGASQAGRKLSNWKRIKPNIENKLNSLMNQSQLQLTV